MNPTHKAVQLNTEYLLAATRRGLLPALGAFACIVLGAGLITAMGQNTYQAEAKLLFKLDRTAKLTGLEKDPVEEPLRPLILPSSPLSSSPLKSELQVVTASPLLAKVIDTLELEDHDGKPMAVDDFRENLEVNVVQSTDVLHFTYVDTDPEESANILNTLVALYRKDRFETAQSEAELARKFIEQQLPISAEKVRDAESKLRLFREANEIVDLDLETDAAVGFLANLQAEQTALRAELKEKASISNTLDRELQLTIPEALAANNLSQSSRVQNILTKLDDVDSEIADQQVEFTEESPTLRILRGRESALTDVLTNRVHDLTGETDLGVRLLQMGSTQQKLIEQYIENDIQLRALTERLNSVEASIQSYQKRAKFFPELEQQQRDLERQVSAAQQTYQNLLNTLQELQVRENQVTNFIEVIEPAAVPDKPNSETDMKILAMGVIVGLAVGAAIIVAIEFSLVEGKATNKLYNPDSYELPNQT